MAVITLRGLSDEIVRKLKAEAKSSGISMNRLLINKIEGKDLKNDYKPKVYHDLDGLFGSISEDEYQELNDSLNEQRVIDEELWK